ncbi:MAG TPA: hypothetical protein VFK72_07710 [Nevskia sp.]|nr:hypothetical protein [Nevskia sp.]
MNVNIPFRAGFPIPLISLHDSDCKRNFDCRNSTGGRVWECHRRSRFSEQLFVYIVFFESRSEAALRSSIDLLKNRFDQ